MSDRIKAKVHEINVNSKEIGIPKTYHEVYPLLAEMVSLFEGHQKQHQTSKDYFADVNHMFKKLDIRRY